MKKQITLNLIILGLILIIGGCESRFYSPIVIVDYRATIKEFSIENGVKATIEEGRGGSENKIILTLPADYQLDYIIPNITVSDSTKGITPKSGEKVVFENQRPITYELLDKQGNKHNFYLYVRRTDKLKVQLLTKEWNSDKLDEFGNIRMQIEAIVNNRGTSFERDNLKFFDKSGTEVNVLNGWTSPTYLNTIYYNNYKNGKENFPKSGDYKVRIVIGDRISEDFPFSIKKSSKPAFPANGFLSRLLKNDQITIKGFNFDANVQYKLKLKNDFINSALEILLTFTDENTLSFSVPTSFEECDYEGSFFENENKVEIQINNKPISIISKLDNTSQFSVGFFGFEDNAQQPNISQKFIFKKGEQIGSFMRSQTSPNKDNQLKLVNLADKKEYVLSGLQKGWAIAGAYWLSFVITDDIPTGQYEVYGIINGALSLRNSKKLEIK